jgi:hypothetical protein
MTTVSAASAAARRASRSRWPIVLKNKEATGRPKDIADIARLRRIDQGE